MHYRTDYIELRQGRRVLSVRHEITDEGERYRGFINGIGCVQSLTREGALCALIRRVVFQAAS